MRRKFIVLGIGLALSIAVSCGRSNHDGDDGRNHVGDKVPRFALQALDGTEIGSKELAGNVTVVDFWATWCQPCIKEIPEYNALYQKFREEKFRMVGITLDSGDAESIKPFVTQLNIEYPIYLGDELVKSEFGGIQVYPTTFILDQEGKIQRKYLGSRPGKVEEIAKIVAELLDTSL